MNKKKLIFTFFIAIAVNFQSLNAMKENEDFRENFSELEKNIKKSLFLKEKPKDPREEIIDKLLSNPSNFSEKKHIKSIKSINSYYNTGYVFGDKESNYRSLYNWIIYTRSLHVLKKLIPQRSYLPLKKEFERANNRLKMIDFYTDNKDYKYCLSGIWSIVATFDKKERENFLNALKEGKDVPKDEILIDFFNSFN